MSGSIALNTLFSIYSNSFTHYLKCSETIGGTIFEQSLSVEKVFKTTLELVQNFNRYRKPLNPLAEEYLTDPLIQDVNEVVNFESRASDNIFQITLISKSIKIFEWVKEVDVEKFVCTLHKYIQFYQQKAQCEIENLGKTHFEWLQYWNEAYEEFSIFIMNFFRNGIVWTGNVSLPLNHVLGDSNIAHSAQQRRALLSDISRGETVLHEPVAATNPLVIKESHVFTKKDNKWIIQNQKNSHKNLVLNTARREDIICIDNCEDCTIVIQSLVERINLGSCQRVTLLFKQASHLEMVDCKECNLHCFEKIAALNIKSCENCDIHLSEKSLDTTIFTFKCSRVNVNFPFEDGVYQNFTINDQLQTKIVPNKGIDTTITPINTI